ncbi:Uncharacterised protein [Enterococcus casseliflavus]|nr:Uncharacterised protein [Enterococcus casseliflavus]
MIVYFHSQNVFLGGETTTIFPSIKNEENSFYRPE